MEKINRRELTEEDLSWFTKDNRMSLTGAESLRTAVVFVSNLAPTKFPSDFFFY